MTSLNRKGLLVQDATPVRVEVTRPVWLRDLDRGGELRACAVGETVRVTLSDYEDGGDFRTRLVR